MATPAISQLLTLRGISLPIPPHDYEAFTYISAGAANDDNVATVIFKQGGASGRIVGTHTFAYVNSTNNILTATFTVPIA